MNPELYFDNNGSTPVHPDVALAYMQSLSSHFGNPGAAHPEGRAAWQSMAAARLEVARGLGATPDELMFTSGGTEANNWALIGSAEAHGTKGHMIVSAIEHKSVLRTADHLVERGWSCTVVQPNYHGVVEVQAIEAAIREDTFLVSVMMANNETGVLQPVAQIGKLCKERGILFHCDAVAALGKIAIDVNQINCDLLSLSGHKMYTPKSCGLLYVRQGVTIKPFIYGCGQQGGMRSGTESAANVVGLGESFRLLREGRFASSQTLTSLTERLWEELQSRVPTAQRNGNGHFLPNTLNVYFPGRPGADLMFGLAEFGISVAAGAAASNGNPSHVLKAMGFSDERARCSLRFSLGCHNTHESITQLLDAFDQVLLGSSKAA